MTGSLSADFFAQNDSLFLDNLQLYSSTFTGWKLQPFNLERVEVLRGPSAILYGGSAPGGLVNAVSKAPPAERIGFIEPASTISATLTRSSTSAVLSRRSSRDLAKSRHTDELRQRRQLFHRAVSDLATRCGHAAYGARHGIPEQDQGARLSALYRNRDRRSVRPDTDEPVHR